VFTSLSRLVCSFCLLIFLFHQLAGPAATQDKKAAPEGLKEAYGKVLQKAEDEYRILFRKPETVPEYWTAITFEIDVGKFDVAAFLLNQLLEKAPPADTDKELIRIEEVKGLSTFLRLRRVRQWSDHPVLDKEGRKNVEILMGRVTSALDKYLADPERIGKFIKSLDAPLVEERAYAFIQLNRSGDRAAPYLAEALRSSVNTTLHRRIQDALTRLNPEVVTPLFAVLTARDAKDAKDVELRVALLDVIRARGERRAVPALWQLAALSRYPSLVRQRARETLAYLLQTEPDRFPSARTALVDLAQRYAHHQVPYEAPRLSPEERKVFASLHKEQQPVVVWSWGAKGLTRAVLSEAQADLFHGLRFAREALQVEPDYRPAQALFVALSLEQAYGQKLDEVLLKKTPAGLQRLLAAVDGDLIEEVLERALSDGNLPVILGTVQALGERGDARYARPALGGMPRGLVRALYYPDRRVQMVAAQALLRSPEAQAPAAAARVVEVLRRFAAADPVRKVVLLFVPEERMAELRKAALGAGFEAVFAANAKDAFGQFHQAANIDAVLIDYTAPQAELPYLLTQLRTDPDVGLLPVLLLAPPERKRPDDKAQDILARQQFADNLGRLADQHRNVWVIPEAAAVAAEPLKDRLQRYSRYAALPESERRLSGSARLRLDRLAGEVKAEVSAVELKMFTIEALHTLLRMARGEANGYDIRPALSAILHALQADDIAPQAVELLGYIPGAVPQQRLAGVVLDARRPKLRLSAAEALNRNVQQYGQLLTQALQPDQLKQLFALADNPAEDAALRTQVALLIGRIGGTLRQTGVRLYRFTPDAAVVPPR